MRPQQADLCLGPQTHCLPRLSRIRDNICYTERRIIPNEYCRSVCEMPVWGDDSPRKFIRPSLLHILSSGFRKICHYGLFIFQNRSAHMALCKRLTNTPMSLPLVFVFELLRRILGLTSIFVTALSIVFFPEIHLPALSCFP